MSNSDVVVDTSDGFVDLRIPLISAEIRENGEAIFIVGGKVFERPIEAVLHLQPGMLPNNLFNEAVTVNAKYDGIKMSLSGERGRNFAIALGELYGSQRSSYLVPMELSFTAVALNGNPAKIDTEEVKFKLFHETGSSDDEEGPCYFEMFLNFDHISGFVEWNEKDTDFRSGVLNSLPAEPS